MSPACQSDCWRCGLAHHWLIFVLAPVSPVRWSDKLSETCEVSFRQVCLRLAPGFCHFLLPEGDSYGKFRVLGGIVSGVWQLKGRHNISFEHLSPVTEAAWKRGGSHVWVVWSVRIYRHQVRTWRSRQQEKPQGYDKDVGSKGHTLQSRHRQGWLELTHLSMWACCKTVLTS